MSTAYEELTGLADSVRTKSGATGKLSIVGMKEAVDGIKVEDNTEIISMLSNLPSTGYSYTVPEGVTELRGDCFSNASSMTSISLPTTLKKLGNSCFSSCREITSVVIPSSVTSISDSIFYDCTKLITAQFNNSFTAFPSYIFDGCSSLKSVNIPKMVTSINYACFRNTKLESIIIPSKVTRIGGYACFYGTYKLTTYIMECEKIPSITSSDFERSASTKVFYMQDTLLESYKTATNWATLYATSGVTFSPMNELPEEFRTQVSQETKDLYGWS